MHGMHAHLMSLVYHAMYVVHILDQRRMLRMPSIDACYTCHHFFTIHCMFCVFAINSIYYSIIDCWDMLRMLPISAAWSHALDLIHVILVITWSCMSTCSQLLTFRCMLSVSVTNYSILSIDHYASCTYYNNELMHITYEYVCYASLLLVYKAWSSYYMYDN